MRDSRLLKNMGRYIWDDTKAEELIDLEICRCPYLVYAAKIYKRNLNPPNFLHLIRKDRGIKKYKVLTRSLLLKPLLLRRSFSDGIS
jgi:hypothetical protein|tara:strand:- start:2318 stop:2578 length:261 start_codon:yes stop_codon:yes gene_type:complete